jgi:hypothetical protein
MKLTLLFVVLWSIKAEESQGVIAARQEMERVQRLINTGALPAAKIADAQLILDDALDEEVLERTLYGHIEETDERRKAGSIGSRQKSLESTI